MLEELNQNGGRGGSITQRYYELWGIEFYEPKEREFRAELDAKQYKKLKDDAEPPEIAVTKRLMNELEEQRNIYISLQAYFLFPLILLH